MGQEITSRDLLPIFDGFLKDLDEVRVGILKHLADFFELLLPRERKLVSVKVGDGQKVARETLWKEFSACTCLHSLPSFHVFVSQYLQRIKEFMNCDNQRNWRFRLELANQVSNNFS